MGEARKPALSSRMRWLLVGSLTLNLLVVGVGAGVLLRHVGAPPPERGAHERAITFGSWTGGLTRDDFRALRQGFAVEDYDFRADLGAERADRAELIALLRAEPFSVETLLPVTDRMEARTAARVAMGNRVMARYLGSLSPEERLALADRMEEAAARKRHPGKPERKGPEE